MTLITTKEDFQALLKKEKAVLFVYTDWSPQSAISLRVFNEWVYEWKTSHLESPIGFYRLNPEEFPQSQKWVAEEARCDDGVDGGFGSVVWLRKGRRIGFVRYAARVEKEELSRLMNKYLGQAVQLDSGRSPNQKNFKIFVA